MSSFRTTFFCLLSCVSAILNLLFTCIFKKTFFIISFFFLSVAFIFVPLFSFYLLIQFDSVWFNSVQFSLISFVNIWKYCASSMCIYLELHSLLPVSFIAPFLCFLNHSRNCQLIVSRLKSTQAKHWDSRLAPWPQQLNVRLQVTFSVEFNRFALLNCPWAWTSEV